VDEELLAIYEEYLRRLNLYQAQLSFLQYFRKHPGLEHKAGVPKGGTFVLVYHEELEQKTNIGAATGLATETARAIASAPATPSASTALSLADYEVLRDFVTQCKDAPSDQQKQVISVLTNYQPAGFVSQGYTIGQGVVVADFYVPYLCCSDCAPVAYILQNDQPTTVFDLEPRSFLFDDAHDYKFTATPPVTTANTEQKPFTGSTVDNPNKLNLWTDAQNNLYLHPANDSVQASFDAKVTYADITVPISIIKPDASFTITVQPDAAGLPEATVKAAQSNATNYQWTQNGATVLDNVSSGTFPVGKGASITLTIAWTLNGAVATDTKKQPIPKPIQ
jgi:hypothetical protein